MKKYSYEGYTPYGAGEMFFLDAYVESDFNGNVTAEIINGGLATFKIIDEETAELVFKSDNDTVRFVKR